MKTQANNNSREREQSLKQHLNVELESTIATHARRTESMVQAKFDKVISTVSQLKKDVKTPVQELAPVSRPEQPHIDDKTEKQAMQQQKDRPIELRGTHRIDDPKSGPRHVGISPRYEQREVQVVGRGSTGNSYGERLLGSGRGRENRTKDKG